MRVLTFLLTVVFGWAGTASANNPPEPEFPILGGSFGQIMRVTVAALPPDPCRVAIRFQTGDVQPPEPDRTLDLLPGQFTFADFDARSLGALPPIGRMVLQPRLIPDGDGSVAGCHASAQLFNAATGWTTEVVAGR
jgi:hypothetical protein